MEKLKEVAYCTMVREKGESNWDQLWDAYKSSSDSDEKRAIIRGIGCSNDSDILRRYEVEIHNVTPRMSMYSNVYSK